MYLVFRKTFSLTFVLFLFFSGGIFHFGGDLRSEPSENVNSVLTVNDSVNSQFQSTETEHGDKFGNIYLLLLLIIVSAAFGRYLAKKINQPVVLGELIMGVILGAILYQLNFPIMTLIRHQDDVNKVIENNIRENTTWNEAISKNLPPESFSPGSYGQELTSIMQSTDFPLYNLTVEAIFLLSSLGVLLLLFLVGLETSIEDMTNVGGMALITAVIGVVVPSILGYFLTMILLPGQSSNLYLFVGATLCATSIGITARVFKDMNKLNIPEAKIVLGAAVIDDILGLIVLSVVAGIISSGTLEISTIGIILLKALLFLGITLWFGVKFLRPPIKFAYKIGDKETPLLFSFIMLLLLAWISDQIGLASIVGAFAAGLIIKEEFFKSNSKDKSRTVKSLIQPIELIFAPVFFVIMGLQVDLSAFLNFDILRIALILTLAAILGKLVSGIFAKGMDKKIIGIGMIPRGEVGLIFASIGKALGILDGAMFSAVIIIVILTTLITPPGLKWAFQKYDKKHLKQ